MPNMLQMCNNGMPVDVSISFRYNRHYGGFIDCVGM